MTIDQIPTARTVTISKDPSSGLKSINEYEILNKLGNGHHGKVYLAKSKTDGSKYAIKEISKITKINILNKNPDVQINKILNEINIMKIILNHPKILKLYKILNDFKSNKIYLVLEYCAYGELRFNKGLTHRYSLSFIKSMIRDVILGLEYTHSLDIIHRDIKPSNLLLDHENAVKISDFGISHRSSSQDTKSDINSGFGTPAFLSPELCNCPEQDELQNFITDKVDIWAFGVSIYCLVFGELPFLGHNEYDLFNKIINDEVCYSLDRFVFLDEVSESEKLLLMDLLKKMLDKDPSQRIGLDNIKKHEFVVNDLKDDEVLKFQKFNEQFDITKNTDKLKKTNSIQRKFKSFFKRRSSSSASATNQPNLSSSTLSPSDTKLDSVIIESEGSDDDSIPIPPHLTRKLTELSVSGTFHTPAKSTNTLDISRPRLDKEKSSFTILPEDAILPTTRLHTPKRASSNSSSLPNSSNSMNLNSILKTKKSSKDDFNGFSIYQSYDDSDDDDDDDDDNDDDEDSDNDSLNSFEDFKDGTDVLAGHHDTYELIVDHETSVDIREVSVDGAKAKVTDISKVKTVNEYLDI